MGFEALLGNDRLKQNLTSSLARGRASHFYLISGAEGSGRKTLSQLLSAALVCTGAEKPCLGCSHCRKAMGGNHPDIITIDDAEKRYVPVELVRHARADIYIQPNEADRKVYIFPRAQDMQPPAQNALLKVLEEPPSYGVFLLITDNPEKLLPTIRSRCTELSLTALSEPVLLEALKARHPQCTPEQLLGAARRSGGYLGQALTLLDASEDTSRNTLDFLEAYAGKDTLALLNVLVPMEKWKRDVLVEELEQWIDAMTDALCTRSGRAATYPLADQIGTARTGQDILRAINALKQAVDYARRNISPGAICGWLIWELR